MLWIISGYGCEKTEMSRTLVFVITIAKKIYYSLDLILYSQETHYASLSAHRGLVAIHSYHFTFHANRGYAFPSYIPFMFDFR